MLDPPRPDTGQTPRDWSAFFLRHERLLTGFALSLTRDAHDAEDLVQSVLATMIHKGVSSGVAPGYVLTSMRRLAMDRYRRDRSVSAGKLVDSVYDLERRGAGTHDRAELLTAALSQLPDDEAEVVMLRTLGELSLRDIASVIDKPLGTVATLHLRAMNRLRREIERLDPIREASHEH